MTLVIGNFGKLVLKVESYARNLLSLTQDHRRGVIMCPASRHLAYNPVYTSDLIGVAIPPVPEAPPSAISAQNLRQRDYLRLLRSTVRSPDPAQMLCVEWALWVLPLFSSCFSSLSFC
jgi:hypothetical protein